MTKLATPAQNRSGAAEMFWAVRVASPGMIKAMAPKLAKPPSTAMTARPTPATSAAERGDQVVKRRPCWESTVFGALSVVAFMRSPYVVSLCCK